MGQTAAVERAQPDDELFFKVLLETLPRLDALFMRLTLAAAADGIAMFF
jgi:hypothetical protein